MAVYNTQADAANTAVRAFLTRIGEYYLKRSFNTGIGKGKQDWLRIKDEIFEGKCAYCGKSDSKLQIEHLIMFNRVEFGLHHPGNIVPACVNCNGRSRNENSSYKSWEQHLSFICARDNEKDKFMDRWNKIKKHIDEGEYRYPPLSTEEKKAIAIIANNLYESIKNEFEQAVKLFQELDEAYTKK
ncbi:MAG: HNH endonuclease [Chitinophagaceae bacterium]|nr:HNH endonuclease [Chitinophagaceae bacterium]